MDTAITGGDEGGSGSGVGSLPGGYYESDKAQVEIIQDPAVGPSCATFIITNEDHTLGNPLRFILSKNPEVEFCGYSIPHPSEPKVNIRVQTKGAPATEALQDGLNTLTEMCAHIMATFEKSMQTHKKQHPEQPEKMQE